VPLPLHNVTTLTEAFRRAVLRLFVRRDLMDVETAQDMLAWPHVAQWKVIVLGTQSLFELPLLGWLPRRYLISSLKCNNEGYGS